MSKSVYPTPTASGSSAVAHSPYGAVQRGQASEARPAASSLQQTEDRQVREVMSAECDEYQLSVRMVVDPVTGQCRSLLHALGRFYLF